MTWFSAKKKSGVISFFFIIAPLFLNVYIINGLVNYKTFNHQPVAVIQSKHKNIEKTFPVIVNDISNHVNITFPSLKNKKNQDMTRSGQYSRVENSLVKQVDDNTIFKAERNIEENYAMPVAEIQTEEKQMIVKEEISGTGETITKAYTVRWKNGKWKKELLFTLKERRSSCDSSCNQKDSLPGIIPSMQ